MVGQIPDDNEKKTNQFSDLLNESYSFVPPSRGDIRKAVILEIRENEIVVDLGAKRDGIIPEQDIQRLSHELLDSLEVGDTIPVYVLNPSDREGNLLVSLNLGLQGQDWENARALLESEDLVEAEVTGYNRGGLLVRFGRLEGFIPASHTLDFHQGFGNPEQRAAVERIIGQVIGLKVIEVNQGRRRLILSQREAQREWRSQQKKRLMSELAVGDVVRGQVTGIRDFGVFVNLGGADGLIHVSELAWHRVPHPSDVLAVGQEIDVYILDLDESQQRIALSLRRTQPDPWEVVEENYQIGQVVEGEVSNVVDFGAFVVLEDGIEGLLHISEMGDGKLVEPYSYVKRGDRVTVRVVRIEPARRRIGFTQRGLGLASPTDSMEAEAMEESPPEEGLDEAVEVPPEAEADEATEALPEADAGEVTEVLLEGEAEEVTEVPPEVAADEPTESAQDTAAEQSTDNGGQASATGVPSEDPDNDLVEEET